MKLLVVTIAISIMIFATLVLAAGFNIDFLNLRETIPNTVALDSYIKIKAVNAWEFLGGRSLDLNSVIVGIIDTGVTTFHPEFEGVNFGNTPSDAKIDFGILDSETGEIETHGTNVAGIIGANNISKVVGENYVFPHMNGVISGVANPSIDYTLEIRAIDLSNLGVTTLFSAAKSIFDLANNGAEVINLSFGGSVFSPVSLPLFFSSFFAHPDIIFAVAAGNNDGSANFFAPAALGDNLDNVITVGATNAGDGRAIDSNFGNAVNISAPGDAVFSPRFFTQPLDIIGDYEFFSGTSASAPMVTGVAGILKALEPEYQKTSSTLVMDPATIKATLISSADPIDTGEPDKPLGKDCFNFVSGTHTGCRLNAHRAVAWWFPPAAVNLEEPINTTIDSIELTWTKPDDFAFTTPDFVSYKIFRDINSNVDTNDTLVKTETDLNQLSFTDAGLTPGTQHFYKVFVFDGAGLSSGSNEVSTTTVAAEPPSPFENTSIRPRFTDFATRIQWRRILDPDFAFYEVFRNGDIVFTTTTQIVGSFIDTALPIGTSAYSVKVTNQAGLSVTADVGSVRKFAQNEIVVNPPGVPEPGDTSFPASVILPRLAIPFGVFGCPTEILVGFCIGPVIELSNFILDSFGHVSKLKVFSLTFNDFKINGRDQARIIVHIGDLFAIIGGLAQDRDYRLINTFLGLAPLFRKDETKNISFFVPVIGSFDLILQSNNQARIAGTLEILP